MHPLDGAYHRVTRASKHLADLTHEQDLISKAIRDGTIFRQHDEVQTIELPNGRSIRMPAGSFEFKTPDVDIPPIVSILLGETVYNIRASLDYFVYELAREDSGVIQEKTQFPIEESEATFFNLRWDTYLRGISDKHVALIAQLQPFAGCEWTKRLRDISNPDKHKTLTTTTSHATLPMVIHTNPDPGQPTMEADADSGVTGFITFSDASPLIETLEQLISQVAYVLDHFKPGFKS